ncbi:MAG TPA: NnrU family protein, partial [Telluria sp.]
EILVIGLALFLGPHLVPTMPALRNSLFQRYGEKRYKGVFSALAALGLVLIVIGYARAPGGPLLFPPVPGAIALAPFAMFASFVLLAAANMRTHLRHTVRHPMLIGVAIWALVHLLANGNARATLLFGAFLAYAVVDIVSATRRHAVKAFTPSAKQDAMAIAGGIALALLVMAFHRQLFGVRALAWGF